MIAKMNKGSGFKGLLSYLSEDRTSPASERGQVIYTNMAGNSPASLSKEFGQFRKLRRGLNKAVSHISISLSPEDRAINNQEFSDIARHFLDEMGYQDSPFVVVRHSDTEHQHIHIVASRITCKGEVVSDAHDYRRAEAVMRQLEKAYGFHSPEEKNERKHNRGEMKMKNDLRKQLEEVLNVSASIQQFVDECKKRDIRLLPHIQGKRMNGFAYRYRGERVKGSDLGKRYAWQYLAVALKFNGDADLALLHLIKEEEEANTPQISTLEEDNKKRRELVRKLLDEEYEAMLRAYFGERLQEITRRENVLSITLNNGVKLNDHGDRITGDSGDQDLMAKEMVALAIAKEWKSLQFSGSEQFVELAMTEAMRNGIEITPKNERQTALLEKVKRIVNEQDYIVQAGEMAEAAQPENVSQKIGQLRTRFGFGQPSKPDTPQDQPPKPKMNW